MTTVTVSPEFQVVIPKEICEQFGIRPGQKLEVIAIGDRIELVPVLTAAELRGVAKGIDTRVPREDE